MRYSGQKFQMKRRTFISFLVALLGVKLAPKTPPTPLGRLGFRTVHAFVPFNTRTRRLVFYAYPNGEAPLAGLLKLAAPEGEETTNYWATSDDNEPQPRYLLPHEPETKTETTPETEASSSSERLLT